jgi:hypothetical protein
MRKLLKWIGIAIRNGVRPDGTPLIPTQMPWEYFGSIPDGNLKAIWMYINTLPGVQ